MYLDCNFANFDNIESELAKFKFLVSHLPFEIRNSTIYGAGKGLFTL